MKTPPLLIGFTLLFWGWQTEFFLWGVLMGVILESWRIVKIRWEFNDSDLNRIWDLCSILFLGTAVFLYSSDDIQYPAYMFPQCLPFVFFPMMLAQAFGDQETISLRTFSWFLRKRNQSNWAKKRINISYLYFSICLLGSSAVRTSEWFYLGSSALMAWALFALRPKRLSLALWIMLLAAVTYGGQWGHRGLNEFQAFIGNKVGNWLGGMSNRMIDAKESQTFIGQIGRIKLSGKIILRVRPEGKSHHPDFLREASYNKFDRALWSVSSNEFISVTAGTNDSWSLLPSKRNTSFVQIAGYLSRGKGILAIPSGTFEIRDLPAVVKTNQFGVIKVESGPGLVDFTALYGTGASIDAPPGDDDLSIPENEEIALTQIANELGLNSGLKKDDEKLRLIHAFFLNNFTYSLYIPPPPNDSQRGRGYYGRGGNGPRRNFSPVSRFLLTNRLGHCEYFATAATLLARKAGIYARYATGFAVDEVDGSGKGYIVRERHAHSWALVYDKRKQSWENFDTTPPSWVKTEENRASFWEPIKDIWSRIWFEFSRWRYSKMNYQKYLVWLLVPLVLILAWRILFRQKRKRLSSNQSEKERARNWPGLDSEFYLVEKKLRESGLIRTAGEPLVKWQQRVEASPLGQNPLLSSIILLHQKYRFDPEGLSWDERQELKKKVEQWLAELKLATEKAVK